MLYIYLYSFLMQYGQCSGQKFNLIFYLYYGIQRAFAWNILNKLCISVLWISEQIICYLLFSCFKIIFFRKIYPNAPHLSVWNLKLKFVIVCRHESMHKQWHTLFFILTKVLIVNLMILTITSVWDNIFYIPFRGYGVFCCCCLCFGFMVVWLIILKERKNYLNIENKRYLGILDIYKTTGLLPLNSE